MVRLIHTTGALTDAQIKLIYDTARKAGVQVVPWRDTPSPARDAFRWAVEGGLFKARHFVKFLKTLG